MCEHVRRRSQSSAQDATRQSQPNSSTETPQPLTPPWYTYPVNYNHYNMADPKKQEKDYTKEVDAILPEARSLAKVCFEFPPLCKYPIYTESFR